MSVLEEARAHSGQPMKFDGVSAVTTDRLWGFTRTGSKAFSCFRNQTHAIIGGDATATIPGRTSRLVNSGFLYAFFITHPPNPTPDGLTPLRAGTSRGHERKRRSPGNDRRQQRALHQDRLFVGLLHGKNPSAHSLGECKSRKIQESARISSPRASSGRAVGDLFHIARSCLNLRPWKT